MKRALFVAFTLALVAAALTSGQAATQSFSDTIPLQTTNWSKTATLPKFDPALGTLTSITFTVASELHSQVKFESLDAAPALVTTSLAGVIRVTRPDASLIIQSLPLSQHQENVGAFDGAIDFGGTSGATDPDVTAAGSDSLNSPPPASDLALFTGVGNIILPVTATANVAVTGPGNLVQQVNTQAKVIVTVRYTYTPVRRTTDKLYQAYPAGGGVQTAFRGYTAPGLDPITATPGVFWLIPGTNWANFVAAAQAGDQYSIKDVQLKKVAPTSNQCQDVFPDHIVIQQGTPNIRTWWPLMYEKPGTKWTLTITYGTPTAKLYPGEPVASFIHQAVYEWEVGVDLDHLRYVLALFHEVPYGKDEVPLISDEPLYADLQARVTAIQAASQNYEKATLLGDFELLVSDHCIYTSPRLPYAQGVGRGLGIANSEENPACCKLLLDAGYLLGIYGLPSM